MSLLVGEIHAKITADATQHGQTVDEVKARDKAMRHAVEKPVEINGDGKPALREIGKVDSAAGALTKADKKITLDADDRVSPVIAGVEAEKIPAKEIPLTAHDPIDPAFRERVRAEIAQIDGTIHIQVDDDHGRIAQRAAQIGADAGHQAGDGARKQIERAAPGVSAAGIAMFAGLPVGAMAASLGVGAVLAGVPIIFGAIAASAVASNNKIGDSYRALGEDVFSRLEKDAAPLAPAIANVANQTDAAFRRMEPSLKGIFSDLDVGIAEVTGGVLDLATNAMPGLRESVAKSDPVFRGFHVLLADTGTGISRMFHELTAGAGSSGHILADTGVLIDHMLGFVGRLLATISNQGAPVFHEFVGVLTQVEAAFIGLVQGALPVFAAYTSTMLGGVGALLHVLQPIAPELGKIGASALTAKAGFGLLNAVSFGGVSKSLEGVKQRVKDAEGAGGKMSAALSGIASGAGIAGIASIGFGLVMSQIAQQEQIAAERAQRMSTATQTLSDLLKKGADVGGAAYLAALTKIAAEIPGLDMGLQDLGSNLSTASDMATKGTKQWNAYTKSLDDSSTPGERAIAAMLGTKEGLDELRGSAEDAQATNIAYDLSLRGIASTGISQVDAALLGMAQSTGDADNKFVSANQRTKLLQSAMETLASSTASADEKLAALTSAMDTYTGRVPTAEEATQAVNADMRDLVATTKDWTTHTKGSQVALDKGKLSLKAFAASMINADGTINTTTATGSAFQDQLEQIQTDLYTQVTAMHANGAGQGALTARVQATRDAFIAQAVKMGFTKQAAVELANKYGLIPSKVATLIMAKDAASGVAQGVLNKLHELTSKTWVVNLTTRSNGVHLATGRDIGMNAGGTDNWRGGLSVVGEEGPELLDLPRGSRIIPADKTRDMIKHGQHLSTSNTSSSVDRSRHTVYYISGAGPDEIMRKIKERDHEEELLYG